MIAGAVALGLLIGLALGALGGGGSVLTVPALVFLLDMSAQEATTASLVIVGVTAAAATIVHARSGRTRWKIGLLLAALGLPASVLGSGLNQQVDQDVLLAGFAALMLLAATGMLLRARSGTEHDAPAAEETDSPGSTGSQDARGSTLTLDRRRTAPAWTRSPLRHAPALAAAGLGIGFLTGFLGVGGGFVIVPVLVVLLRVPMPAAVGTSLLIISLNSAIALAARAGSGNFAWDVIVPFTLAAIVGSLAGQRVADRIRPARLTVAFAVLLVAVALYVGTRAVLGLS